MLMEALRVETHDYIDHRRSACDADGHALVVRWVGFRNRIHCADFRSLVTTGPAHPTEKSGRGAV